MNKQNIIKKKSGREDAKSVLINIRITPNVSKWLKEKNYSPTGIFEEALKDLECPYMK